MPKSANRAFEDYVYHSLLYYELDDPEIPDSEFDYLCRDLLARWALVTHPDKGLADESDLGCGTGCQMSGRYPEWAIKRAEDSGHDTALYRGRAKARALTVTEVIEEYQATVPVTTWFDEPPKGYTTLVGSRETPEPILSLMSDVGCVLCDQGYRGRSGGAGGADTAFHQGAQRSERFNQIGFEIYLPDATMFDKEEFGFQKPDPSRLIFNAMTFTDTYEEAKAIAFQARGSFDGLRSGGIKLHTRNAYQVLGQNLATPSRGLICWARPVGKQGKVHGGTNTAVQIALNEGIPVINLYRDEDVSRIHAFLDKHRVEALEKK